MTPSTPKRRRCAVCRKCATASFLCGPCIRSLDAATKMDGSLAAVIEWAAQRARYFSGRGRS
jgi:hypothetical protein